MTRGVSGSELTGEFSEGIKGLGLEMSSLSGGSITGLARRQEMEQGSTSTLERRLTLCNWMK